jgi:Fe-S-cluster containining protein
MRREHLALIDKVDAFTRVAFARRRADMACAQGCSSCCEVSLTVTTVEAAEIRIGLAALSSDERLRVAERGANAQAHEPSSSELDDGVSDSERCVMLDPLGRCVIYQHRPLVCRTQGHALRYPAGFIPEQSVRARTGNGDVTHCPLNFTMSAPKPEDVLDAERVDQLLGLVARRFSLANGQDPGVRVALCDLAARTDTE